MPFPNDIWTEKLQLSHPKMNNMTIVGLEGSQFAGLSPKYDGQVCYCRSTSGSFAQGHWYGWDNVLQKWIDMSDVANWYLFWNQNRKKGYLDKKHSTKEEWNNISSGTGAQITNEVTGGIASIKMETGTQTTGVSTNKIGGPLFDFSKAAFFRIIFRTDSTVTGQVVKIGVGMDIAGTGPAVTNMFGIEYCDGSANWQIHSGNGTNQGNTDTGIAVATSTVYGFLVEYIPNSQIKVTFDDGTVKTRSSFIPSTGTCAQDSLFLVSVANNNGSSTNKTLRHRGIDLTYEVVDSKWQ